MLPCLVEAQGRGTVSIPFSASALWKKTIVSDASIYTMFEETVYSNKHFRDEMSESKHNLA